MGNKSSLLLRPEEIAQIQDETGCKDEYNVYLLFVLNFEQCSCYFFVNVLVFLHNIYMSVRIIS